jgi:F0F1-type ATP synthase epsilon subunit
MIVAPGILTITEPEVVKKAELNSGFLEIQKDKMTILAEDIKWL